MTADDGARRKPAVAMLGHIGSFGLRLDPVITLTPDPPKPAALASSRTPGLELTGNCKNLSGRVPCSITWVIERESYEVARHDTKTAAARFEHADRRNGTLWLEATGTDRYRVVVRHPERSPRSGAVPAGSATRDSLVGIDALELDLLGHGRLGYRIIPDTPRRGGELEPEAGLRFDSSFTFDSPPDLRVGMELVITPTRFPPWLADQPLRLTIYNSDGGGASWSFRDLKLGGRVVWRFGCHPSDPSQASGPVLAYHDHDEGDGWLNYGVRIEFLDNAGSKGGAKGKESVLATVELANRWSAPVPALTSFQLEPKIAHGSLYFHISATFTGFHDSVEIPLTAELWAVNDAGDVRPALELLALSGHVLLPVAGSRMTWHVVARADHGVHRVSEQLLEIEGAGIVCDGWRFFAEMHVRSGTPGGDGTPFRQLAAFGGDLSGADHGVRGRALTASGVATPLVSLAGQDPPDELSRADQLDACILAACIWTQARDATRPEMRAIGATVVNRVRSRRWDAPEPDRHHATAYARVVLAPKQFPQIDASSHATLRQALETADAAGDRKAIDAWASKLTPGSSDRTGWEQALAAAERLIRFPETNPFHDRIDTMYVHALASKGPKPAWATEAAEVRADDISSTRFKFYRAVP